MGAVGAPEREAEALLAEHRQSFDAGGRAMSKEFVTVRRAAGSSAVRVKQVIPAGLRPVPRDPDTRDPRRST